MEEIKRIIREAWPSALGALIAAAVIAVIGWLVTLYINIGVQFSILVVLVALGMVGGAYLVYKRYQLKPHPSKCDEGGRFNKRGVDAFNQGQHREALNYFQQALDIRREVGDRAGEGATLDNIGFVYDSQGLYDQALKTYQDALVIHREVGDRAEEGTTLNNIVCVRQPGLVRPGVEDL
jgi:tetratricopeptide (TPR) repeat protein